MGMQPGMIGGGMAMGGGMGGATGANCPGWHGLSPFIVPAGRAFNCDWHPPSQMMTKKAELGAQMFGCRQCNVDM